MPHRAAILGFSVVAAYFGVPVGVVVAGLWMPLAFQVDNVTASLVTVAGCLATIYAIYNKAYEGSFRQQLRAANARIDENEAKIDHLEGENKSLKVENALLRQKLAERDETIALRDRAIQDRDAAIARRDRTIDENARSFQRLSADTADLAEALLIRKGDARPRTKA